MPEVPSPGPLPAMMLATARVCSSEFAIEQLENGRFTNPSLTLLRRLARVYHVSISELVDGVPQSDEILNQTLRTSKENLHRYGEEVRMPHDEVTRLWRDFRAEYDATRHDVAEARTEPVEIREWRERHAAMKGTKKAKQTKMFDDD